MPSSALERILPSFERLRGGQGGQYTARCPACAGRRPALSIRDAGDRMLLHCHRGCDVATICHAIGLTISDLFYEQLKRSTGTSARYQAPVLLPSLRDEITAEIVRYQHIHGLTGQRLLMHEINGIRTRVAARRSAAVRREILLAPLPIPLWDAAFAGLERDESWPGAFWLSLYRTSFELLGVAIDYDPYAPRIMRIPCSVLSATEDYAVQLIRNRESAVTAQIPTVAASLRRAA